MFSVSIINNFKNSLDFANPREEGHQQKLFEENSSELKEDIYSYYKENL